MYISKFTSEAVEQIKKLPKGVRNALKKAFKKTLLENPTSCADELTEPLAGFRSFHFGDYRVVYRVYEDLNAIAVVGVGKKDAHAETDLYRKLEKLASTGKLADKVLKSLRLIAAP